MRRLVGGRTGRSDAANPFRDQKALALGLKPIVVINKIDKPSARPSWVIDQTFELFDNLGATDEQLDFPIVYASGLSGFAKLEETDESSDMRPLFDTILKYTPAPAAARTSRCNCKFPNSTTTTTPAASVSVVS